MVIVDIQLVCNYFFAQNINVLLEIYREIKPHFKRKLHTVLGI